MRKSKTIDYRVPMEVWSISPDLIRIPKEKKPRDISQFLGLGT